MYINKFLKYSVGIKYFASNDPIFPFFLIYIFGIANDEIVIFSFISNLITYLYKKINHFIITILVIFLDLND